MMKFSIRISCLALAALGSTMHAATPLQSPWDLHPVAVSKAAFSCPTVPTLPHDIVATDFYSDAKHSIVDEKRKADYDAASAMFRDASEGAEKAADNFQKTGSAQAAACVVRILLQQAQANAMTGSMSSNQANYVQNWTMGGFAIAYLKVRSAGPQALAATPQQTTAVQAWMKRVGEEIEDYFQARREKKTKDGQNNHLYWAGFAVMSAGIAADDHKLYDWGVSTYEDGVQRIAADGTLQLEIDRGQRALHYHLFALAPLVTMAELGTANGQDLYAYNHDALHTLVNRSFGGLTDNTYFSAKAGVVQDTPEGGKIKSTDVIWVTPYLRRFPNASIAALLQRADLQPYGYLGGLPPP